MSNCTCVFIFSLVLLGFVIPYFLSFFLFEMKAYRAKRRRMFFEIFMSQHMQYRRIFYAVYEIKVF